MPDKHEVDGSIPFEPTKLEFRTRKRMKISMDNTFVYEEKFLRVDTVIFDLLKQEGKLE